MPAARATSSVLVPSNPCFANSATATRSTSARRSSALIRTAGVITRHIVSDDSLPCQAAAFLARFARLSRGPNPAPLSRVEELGSVAVGLQEAGVGLRGLFVAVVGVGVVVAAMAVLAAGQPVTERHQAAGEIALARRRAQRERKLQVGVAVEARLRVR